MGRSSTVQPSFPPAAFNMNGLNYLSLCLGRGTAVCVCVLFLCEFACHRGRRRIELPTPIPGSVAVLVADIVVTLHRSVYRLWGSPCAFCASAVVVVVVIPSLSPPRPPPALGRLFPWSWPGFTSSLSLSLFRPAAATLSVLDLLNARAPPSRGCSISDCSDLFR